MKQKEKLYFLTPINFIDDENRLIGYMMRMNVNAIVFDDKKKQLIFTKVEYVKRKK